jgi:putative hemolysin
LLMKPKRSTDRDSVPERKRAFPRRSGSRRSGRDAEEKLQPGNARAFIGSRWALFAMAFFAVAFVLVQQVVFADDASKPPAEASGSVFMDAAIVVCLVFITAIFVMAETALLTVRRPRIEQLVEENNRAAKLVSQLLSEPTRMLATLQVGLTMVQLFSAGEAANRFVGPVTAFLLRIGSSIPFIRHNAGTISFFLVIMSVGLLTLVIGEIAPKSIAIRHNEKLALIAAYPIRGIQIVFKPLVWLVTFLSNLLVRPFGGTATFHATAYSEEELKIMVEQSEEHGVIETEEKEMIHKVFEFADTVVRKVMTPRLDIAAVEADVTIDDLIRAVTASGHSRLPIYDDNLDNIIGIVHVKDVLKGVTGETRVMSIRELMRPPYFIPENKRVDDLLKEFKGNKMQMAVVRDEYGTVTGVVTIEDLIEEVFGDIQDEYDVEEPLIRQVDENTCIIDGKMSLDDFNDRMGAELPVEESDTLGGFVFGLLGHQPDQGESSRYDGFEFHVEETDGRRILKVRVCKLHLNDVSNDGSGNGSLNGHGTSPGSSEITASQPPFINE